MLDTDQLDDADLSETLLYTTRKMRLRLLEHGDQALKELVYQVITLSIHEAKRAGRNEVLDRCHLSNKAEA